MSASDNNEFDISSAVDTIGGDLFSSDAGEGAGQNEEELDVTLSDVEATDEVVETPEGEAAETSNDPDSSTTITAPKTWRKEAQAEWDKLSPTVQSEILKREEDMFRGLEGYKQDATFGKSMQQALAEYMPTLQQYNINPVAQVAGLMKAHHTLVFGDAATKQALFRQIAADYGVELPSAGESEAPFTDPQVKTLMDEVKSLQSKLSHYESAQQASVIEKTKSEIDAFLADPAFPYAKELTTDMAKLISSGNAKGLKDAYEQAIWLNPTVRQKELARQQKESAEQKRIKAQTDAEKARKASAANVTTSSKDASRTAPVGTMDDTLQQTLTDILKRGS